MIAKYEVKLEMCPACGRLYHERPSKSKFDGATPICPKCADLEKRIQSPVIIAARKKTLVEASREQLILYNNYELMKDKETEAREEADAALERELAGDTEEITITIPKAEADIIRRLAYRMNPDPIDPETGEGYPMEDYYPRALACIIAEWKAYEMEQGPIYAHDYYRYTNPGGIDWDRYDTGDNEED